MKRRSNNLVSDLTWDDVARRLAAGAVAVVPVGAGAKQHGLHLPMGSDQIQVEYFAARLAESVDALIWPTLLYGPYPAFVAYAGSISLTDTTFEAIVGEIVEGLLGYGARKILLLNAGLSTLAPIRTALLRVSEPARVKLVTLYGGERYDSTVAEIREQVHGSHADEIETSILLALAPEAVMMDRAQASPALFHGPQPGALTPFDAASPNYSPSGSFGDPTKASRAKGEILIEAILRDLIAAASEN